nr:TrbI/VirB10 family protein [Stakelama flava]
MRGKPRPVARFRRGVVIAGVGVVAAVIAGVAGFALRTADFSPVALDRDPPELASDRVPESLAGAPDSYAQVPELGPPLPGDLGGPVLERQRELGVAPPQTAPDPAAQAAEQARQRAEAERIAARQSALLVDTRSAAPMPAQPVSSAPLAPAATPAPASSDTGSRLVLDPERDPGAQQRKLDVLSEAPSHAFVSADRLQPPASPNLLSAGSVISASLITGINSDLPGIVTAQVTRPAFDSLTGRTLLIPQGSRLIGSYDSVVAFGQQRALVIWQRLILPDGSSIAIDNWPASDTQGYAGLADRLDLHSWQLLKGVGLSTLLGVGTQLSFSDESDLVEALRDSAQQSGARAGDRLVERNLNVQPTIRIRPGWPLRVVVNKDLVLRPWKGM